MVQVQPRSVDEAAPRRERRQRYPAQRRPGHRGRDGEPAGDARGRGVVEHRRLVNLVLDDEFPLNVFFETLNRKLSSVIDSTKGITA